jgi:hypothetical protein
MAFAPECCGRAGELCSLITGPQGANLQDRRMICRRIRVMLVTIGLLD